MRKISFLLLFITMLIPLSLLANETTHSIVNTNDHNIFIFGGIVKGDQFRSNSGELYDTSKNTWTSLPSMPASQMGGVSTQIGKKIYFFGGLGGSSYPGDNIFSLNITQVFDIEKKEWLSLSPMSTPRDGATYAVVNNKVYLFGGIGGISNERRILTSVEVYDIATNRWSYLPSMKTAREGASVAVLDGKIYLFGGGADSDTNDHYNLSEVFDTKTNTWTVLPSMKFKRLNATSTVLDGKIYIFGGSDGRQFLTNGEVFNPATNTWSLTASMNAPIYRAGSAVINGKIYLFGGDSGPNNSNSGEIYNPQTDSWTSLPPMLTPRTSAGHVVMDSKIYLIGGSIFDNLDGQNFLSSVEVFDVSTNKWSYISPINLPRLYPFVATVQKQQ